jgi:hypothetical protein
MRATGGAGHPVTKIEYRTCFDRHDGNVGQACRRIQPSRTAQSIARVEEGGHAGQDERLAPVEEHAAGEDGDGIQQHEPGAVAGPPVR